MSITVTVAGYKDLKGELKALPPLIEKSVIGQMAQIAFDSAFEGIGRHNKTGVLLDSLYNREIPNVGREVGNDPDRAPYAVFVNYGFAPFKMVPTTKKALRWAVPGGFAFSKGHMHPGYIGDDYMGRAKDDAISAFQQVIDTALKEALP